MSPLDDLWDFSDPEASEHRFREAAAGSAGRAALTQVARALGLQGRYAEAHAVLDEVEVTRPDPEDAEVAVRCALERGRVRRSAGDPDAARPCFETAATTARDAGLERLHVDALHMLAMDLPPPQSITAHLEAVQVARTARSAAARAWEASLLNNLGLAQHDAGDLPAALATFEEALAVCRRDGDDERVRVARWMVGWTLRLLGRDDEALAVQRSLRAELDALGASDPYVDEELDLLSGGGRPGR
jgi:tetratricopeptide (TPR) repeat protein